MDIVTKCSSRYLASSSESQLLSVTTGSWSMSCVNKQRWRSVLLCHIEIQCVFSSDFFIWLPDEHQIEEFLSTWNHLYRKHARLINNISVPILPGHCTETKCRSPTGAGFLVHDSYSRVVRSRKHYLLVSIGVTQSKVFVTRWTSLGMDTGWKYMWNWWEVIVGIMEDQWWHGLDTGSKRRPGMFGVDADGHWE